MDLPIGDTVVKLSASSPCLIIYFGGGVVASALQGSILLVSSFSISFSFIFAFLLSEDARAARVTGVRGVKGSVVVVVFWLEV